VTLEILQGSNLIFEVESKLARSFLENTMIGKLE